jgi:hypothetical protein
VSTISLRLPDSLHETARKLAEQENISMNQLITLALAEKIAALTTEAYLTQRAQRGDSAKFRRALSKVAEAEPDEADRL